jgi:hypothetical protein
MSFIHKRVLPWVAPLVFVILSGCGDSGPTLVPVSGILTYKGKPVANAAVRFMPENGRPSTGITDEEGRFALVYDAGHEGAMVGKHHVWVKLRPITRAQQQAVMMGKKPPMSQEMAAFFDKYGQKNSKMEVVIDKNTKELQLNWD